MRTRDSLRKNWVFAKMRMLSPVILFFALASPLHAQSVAIELTAGLNLVSLPPAALGTADYTAASLASDTGATFVHAVGGTARIFLPQGGAPDFQFEPLRPILLSVATSRRSLLRIPRVASVSIAPVDLPLERGLLGFAPPLLAGAASRLRASDLTTLTSAAFLLRTTAAAGVGQFQLFLPGVPSGDFRIEPGRGLLIGLPAGGRTTSIPLYGDLDLDGLPDDVQSLFALTGGKAGDTDGDGLPNQEELQLGTDPSRADTDGDGVPDALELSRGFDPRDAATRPLAPRVDSAAPSTARNDAAASIVLTGIGFTGATEVRVSGGAGTALTSLAVESDSRLSASLPAGVAAGSYGLVVRTPVGVSDGVARLLTVTAPPVGKSFKNDVFPIFGRRCSGCHSAFSSNGGWAAASAAASLKEINDFRTIVPGSPSSSTLLLKPSGVIRMSFGIVVFGPSDPDYKTIESWIAEGALDN